MTEQEAKTKWCPKYQVATSGGDSSTFEMDNRPMEHEQDADKKWHPTGRINPFACCIGSACMAFRTWSEVETITGTPTSTSVSVRHEHRGGVYCGLAGKP